MRKIITLFLSLSLFISVQAQLEYKDVAGIFYARCASCHHENMHAQSMMNYSQTFPWSSSINNDLNTNKMPPWPPDTTYTRFVHERLISTAEKNAILSWISTGSQKGDTTLAPNPPSFAQYQLYGTPSLVLSIPTFTSNATNSTDAYNCFSIPTGLTQDVYLRAYEIVAGNYSIVHHVVVNIDTTGTIASNTAGNCFTEPGQFSIGGYTPGTGPTVFPGVAPLKCGVRIKAGSNVIMQLHYPAGTQGQVDSTKIRLYFYPAGATGIRPIYSTTPLQNWSMIMPANQVTTYTAKYPSSGGFTTPISIFSTFPHSHKVCSSIINYADNGTITVPLIKINKWDFNWQGYYRFPNLVKIPTGYTLRSSHVYDNTTNNLNNPNSPPQNVTAGTSTGNEMLFDAFQWLYYQPGDETIDIASLYTNDSLLTDIKKQALNTAGTLKTFVYPNPAQSKVSIGYFVNAGSDVKVDIFDMHGKRIKTIAKRMEKPGAGEVEWELNGPNGEQIADGVYFYTVSAGKLSAQRKIIVSK
jgi:Secretion system C-terminal sorting domain